VCNARDQPGEGQLSNQAAERGQYRREDAESSTAPSKASSERERDSYGTTIRETLKHRGFPVGLVPLALEASRTLPDVAHFCERLAAVL
jgi:hypothetical protein